MHDVDKRNLSLDKSRALKTGAEHFAAYVGPPKQWDFMGAAVLAAVLARPAAPSSRNRGWLRLAQGRALPDALSRQGNCTASSPSKGLIDDMVAEELGEELIGLRAPHFAHRDDFDATEFGVALEFIVAQSVFSHLIGEAGLVGRALP